MRWIVAAAGAALLAGTGCVGFRGPEDVRREMVRASGVELEREVGLSVGPAMLGLVRLFSSEEEIPLRGVRSVQVGVYAVRDRAAARPLGSGDFPGWDPLVHVVDGSDQVWVLARTREQALRALLVVVVEPDEWTVVRLRGRDLKPMIAEAVRYALDEADHPELYPPTRAELALSPDRAD
ncbi:MAG TPA: hypothetical protein VJS92_00450 [Candidatus Polarisedimenticolaceae bacterium]|nr:hypothetical protein [Candidatus Polarisedimenticolaceae bacterium]